METVEIFMCPECGAPNYLNWAEGETSRHIPCIMCAWDETRAEGQDPVRDPEKGEVFSKFIEICIPRGRRWTVERCKGEKTIRRDVLSFREVAG